MTQHELDAASFEKAKAFFITSAITDIEIGTTKGLQEIHKALFNGLYDFAGVIRTKNIAKSNFRFANSLYLPQVWKPPKRCRSIPLRRSLPSMSR